METYFRRFAQVTSKYMGTPWAFIAALMVILVWALTGPLFASRTPVSS